MVRLPFWALLALIAVSAVRCSADADPLMGAYAIPLCPMVCEGCEGPTRTVTIWSGGGGEYTSDGAQFFCNAPNAPVASMSVAQIEESASRMRASELSGFAALGASFLMLLVLALPIVPLSALLRHQRAGARAHVIEERIAELSHRLRRAPPAPRRDGLVQVATTALVPALAVGVATFMIVAGLLL